MLRWPFTSIKACVKMLQTETDRNNLANSVYSLHIWLYLLYHMHTVTTIKAFFLLIDTKVPTCITDMSDCNETYLLNEMYTAAMDKLFVVIKQY